MYQTIKYEIKNGIGYITINRPEALNALNRTVLEELFDVFNKIDVDDDVRAVILTGEGRSFVAGADIAQMSSLTVAEGRSFGAYGQKVMNFIEKVEKPVIAAVNGFALGGGWPGHHTRFRRYAETFQAGRQRHGKDADPHGRHHKRRGSPENRSGGESNRA